MRRNLSEKPFCNNGPDGEPPGQAPPGYSPLKAIRYRMEVDSSLPTVISGFWLTLHTVLRPVKIIGRMSTAAFATDDMQIRKAILYIHRNYQKKISVKDVMGEVALSRRLLERRFKSVTGQTLYQYISELKIKHFAEMLLDTDDQVVNIALSLGETDTKSISRRFKQFYGCSPHAWREQQRGGRDDVPSSARS